MNKTKIGIFFTLLLVLGVCSSCGEKKSNNKLVLNEVLITNEGNYQDDYGLHSAWIEIFNRSFGSAYLAGCLLNVSIKKRNIPIFNFFMFNSQFLIFN